MRTKYVFNGYYKINKLNCFTINHTIHKKCIYKNKAAKKEDFIERFVEEAKVTISDFPRVCWCCTHDAFRQILRDAGLKVYGIDLIPGNISNLIQYWECEDCKTCPEKEECYIPEYIKNSYNKNWKRCEGPCLIINPKK